LVWHRIIGPCFIEINISMQVCSLQIKDSAFSPGSRVVLHDS